MPGDPTSTATFKQGDALTPIAVMSLMDLPESAQHQTAIEKGTRFLADLVLGDGTKASTRVALTYPVYTTAGAVTVMSRSKDVHLGPALAAWLMELRKQQLVETLGWQPDDPFYGGWGYAKDLPKKPIAGQPLSPLAEPNLSATVFALEALRAAGVDNTDPAVRKALCFVQRCQNYSDDAAKLEPSFDDGGFFFIQNDPTRNKAGADGIDGGGRERYSSYGSSTADGLRRCCCVVCKPANPVLWPRDAG